MTVRRTCSLLCTCYSQRTCRVCRCFCSLNVQICGQRRKTWNETQASIRNRWFSRYVIAAVLVDENKRFLISSSSPEIVVLFLDSLLPRPENGAEPRREKGESCINCRRMLGTTPFFPRDWGKNHIWKEIPNLGRVYSQCFYTENMAVVWEEIMMPSFWRQLISHLRNASLTLCPRRNKFKLSMQSLLIMMFLLK